MPRTRCPRSSPTGSPAGPCARPGSPPRLTAAARAAAGVDEEHVDASDVAGLLATVSAGRDATFLTVLARSSLLVDGLALGGRDPSAVQLADGAVVEVLPPFAGG
jgi:molybdopterin converting factor small subunit